MPLGTIFVAGAADDVSAPVVDDTEGSTLVKTGGVAEGVEAVESEVFFTAFKVTSGISMPYLCLIIDFATAGPTSFTIGATSCSNVEPT